MRFSAATMYKRTCINGPLYGTDGQTRRQRPRTISNPVSLIGSVRSRDSFRLANTHRVCDCTWPTKYFYYSIVNTLIKTLINYIPKICKLIKKLNFPFYHIENYLETIVTREMEHLSVPRHSPN